MTPFPRLRTAVLTAGMTLATWTTNPILVLGMLLIAFSLGLAVGRVRCLDVYARHGVKIDARGAK